MLLSRQRKVGGNCIRPGFFPAREKAVFARFAGVTCLNRDLSDYNDFNEKKEGKGHFWPVCKGKIPRMVSWRESLAKR